MMAQEEPICGPVLPAKLLFIEPKSDLLIKSLSNITPDHITDWASISTTNVSWLEIEQSNTATSGPFESTGKKIVRTDHGSQS